MNALKASLLKDLNDRLSDGCKSLVATKRLPDTARFGYTCSASGGRGYTVFITPRGVAYVDSDALGLMKVIKHANHEGQDDDEWYHEQELRSELRAEALALFGE